MPWHRKAMDKKMIKAMATKFSDMFAISMLKSWPNSLVRRPHWLYAFSVKHKNKLKTPKLERYYYIHGLTTGYKSLSYQLNQDFSLVEAWVLLKPKHNSRVCHHAYLSCISSFAIPTSLINFTWLSLKACSLGAMGSNQF